MGVAYGLTGGALAIGTGYLGGHLSFARGVGTGDPSRGRGRGAPADREVEGLLEAGGAIVGEDAGDLLVEGPNTR